MVIDSLAACGAAFALSRCVRDFGAPITSAVRYPRGVWLTERVRQHAGTPLLVLGLLAGLFGMHALTTLAVPNHTGTMATAHPVSVQPVSAPAPSDPGHPNHSGHGLGHLCLAVLTAMVALTTAVLLLLRGAGAVGLPREPACSRRTARERRPAAFRFRLCVLRT